MQLRPTISAPSPLSRRAHSAAGKPSSLRLSARKDMVIMDGTSVWAFRRSRQSIASPRWKNSSPMKKSTPAWALDLFVEHVRDEQIGVGVVRPPLPGRAEVAGYQHVVASHVSRDPGRGPVDLDGPVRVADGGQLLAAPVEDHDLQDLRSRRSSSRSAARGRPPGV